MNLNLNESKERTPGWLPGVTKRGYENYINNYIIRGIAVRPRKLAERRFYYSFRICEYGTYLQIKNNINEGNCQVFGRDFMLILRKRNVIVKP